MTALPRRTEDADVTEDTIPTQDETHARIRGLLADVAEVLLDVQPALHRFVDHQPERDRPSGGSWHGLQTHCHVSALLAAEGDPEPGEHVTDELLGAVARFADAHAMGHRSSQDAVGVRGATWTSIDGDLLEVQVGVRVLLRAVSAPFLPGSLAVPTTTSPVSAISPLTPPPRLVR